MLWRPSNGSCFFGPPPWFYSDFATYRELASHDPLVLYQDMLVALDPARHVNNGVPSLHAGALNGLGVRPGERVIHLGAVLRKDDEWYSEEGWGLSKREL